MDIINVDMNKEEYIKQIEVYSSQIDELLLKSQKLEEEYINKCSAIEIGQEITLYEYKTKVNGIFADRGGDFVYEIDDCIRVHEKTLIEQGYKTRKC